MLQFTLTLRPVRVLAILGNVGCKIFIVIIIKHKQMLVFNHVVLGPTKHRKELLLLDFVMRCYRGRLMANSSNKLFYSISNSLCG